MTDAQIATPAPTVTTLVSLAICFGVLSGFSEVVLLAAAKVVLHRYLFLGAHIAWMAPTFYAALFAVLALLLWLAARTLPRLPWMRIACVVFAFLGAYGSLLLLTRLWKPAAAILALGIAWIASFLVVANSGACVRLARRATVPLTGLVVLAWAAVAGSREVGERRALAALPPAAGGPNVLLIILDTVRSLNLSLYGYARATTPNLERLARRAVVFDRGVAPAPWTLPSHTSVFTGRLPDRLETNWTVPLGRGTPLLAEALAARGYQTGGFSANAKYVGRESGLARGFTHYEDFRESPGQYFMSANLTRTTWWSSTRLKRAFRRFPYPGHKSAAHVNASVLSWLDGRDAGRPFFAFLNFMDAHAPYLPPAPFDTVFGRKSGAYDPELEQWFNRPPTPVEARDLILAYDQSLAYLDHQVGALLDSLEARRLLDNTLIIVTADHGEELFEHGTVSHGHTLYLPALSVPILVALPRSVPEGRRIQAWVSLKDIAATILDLVGAPNLVNSDGRSLARFWAGIPTLDTIYAEVRYAPGLPAAFPVSQGDLRAAITGSWQYIETARRQRELFDLSGPGPRRPDLSSDPAYRDSLASLRRWLERRGTER